MNREGAKAQRNTRKGELMNFWEFREGDVRKVSEATERNATTVIGAAIEVHTILGPNLPEIAYRRALLRELTLRGVPHECEHPVPIVYKGELVAEGRVDVLVAGCLVIELKVVEALSDAHRAQVLAHLAAARAWTSNELQRGVREGRHQTSDPNRIVPLRVSSLAP